MTAQLDRLAAEVTAAETELYLAQVAAGIIPPGARRLAYPHEVQARVYFADHAADHDRRVARLLATAADVRRTVLDALADHVIGLGNRLNTGADVAAELARLASSLDPSTLGAGLTDAVATARDTLRAELTAAAEAGREELLDEARDQGIPDAFLTRPPLTGADVAVLDQAADRLARQPVEHVLTVAAAHAATPAIAAGDATMAAYGALDAAEQASPRATEDAASQAASAGSGTGRRLGIEGVTAQPSRIYASELLDANTCDLCRPIDGKEYGSLADALADYPAAEGYYLCEGGGRCRGTLVIVWDEAPTAGTPEGPGPDMTPPGPGGPTPPPVRPGGRQPAALEPPQPRPPAQTPPPPTAPSPSTPPPPAPTPAPAVDTGLVGMTDHEIDRAMHTALAEGDYDTAERMALEADYRADWSAANPLPERDWYGSTTRPYDYRLDARVTPEQRAELDEIAATEAREISAHYRDLEAAGIDLDDLTSGRGTPRTPGAPAGRTIDRLRTEYDDHVYSQYLAAEDVARGTLIRADRYAEFTAKYGGDTLRGLFSGPARQAYYYASRELRDYWEAHPRLSFDEFAVDAGVRSSKIVKRAEAAKQARETGRRLAEEDPELRRARRNQRPRRALTPGEQLERDRARAARNRRRIVDAGGTIDPT